MGEGKNNSSRPGDGKRKERGEKKRQRSPSFLLTEKREIEGKKGEISNRGRKKERKKRFPGVTIPCDGKKKKNYKGKG